jgi:hypothetical protein
MSWAFANHYMEAHGGSVRCPHLRGVMPELAATLARLTGFLDAEPRQ